MAKQLDTKSMGNLMWVIIETMDWKTHSHAPRGYDTMKAEFMCRYDKSIAEQLSAFVSARFNELYKTVEAYENAHERLDCYGGDDSFGDMLHHSIGLGKKNFKAVTKNPKKLDSIEFVESFSYAIPHVTDYEELEAK